MKNTDKMIQDFFDDLETLIQTHVREGDDQEIARARECCEATLRVVLGDNNAAS